MPPDTTATVYSFTEFVCAVGFGCKVGSNRVGKIAPSKPDDDAGSTARGSYSSSSTKPASMRKPGGTGKAPVAGEVADMVAAKKKVGKRIECCCLSFTATTTQMAS